MLQLNLGREKKASTEWENKKLYKFTYDLANNMKPNEKMRSNLRRSNGYIKQQNEREREKKIDNYWL